MSLAAHQIHLLLAIAFSSSFVRVQPNDGHHDAPQHVVVASLISSYIIKLFVVLTVVHLFTLY